MNLKSLKARVGELSMKITQKWGLQGKAIVTLGLLVTCSLLILDGATYWQSYQLIKQQALEVSSVTTFRSSMAVADEVENGRHMLSILFDMPPVQGIIRAREAGGIDPIDYDSSNKWQRRMEQIFSGFIAHNPNFLQIRYLDETGIEQVRVDSDGRNVRVFSHEELQNKADRPYFNDTIRLGRGEIYHSNLDLNREHGSIMMPHQATYRMATPLFNDSGILRGVLVINLSGDRLLSQAIPFNKSVTTYVVNQDGYFLLHPNITKSFGFDLGLDIRLKDELPSVARAVSSQDEGALIDQTSNSVITFKKVFFDPADPLRYWVLIHSTPFELAFKDIRTLQSTLLLSGAVIVLISLLLILWLTNRHIIKPIKVLAAASRQMTQGDLAVRLPVEQVKDDFRTVYLTLNEFAETQQRATNHLEQQVSARTAELEKSLSNLRISEERYRMLVDGVKDVANLMLDANGLVMTWNKGASRLHGYEEKEIISKDYSIFYPPEAIAAGKPQALLIKAKEKGRIDYEGWRVRKDGSRFMAHVTLTALYGDNQELRGYSKITRDITEHKDIEDQLNVFFELSLDMMCISSVDGYFKRVNQGFTAALGWSNEEMLSRPSIDFIHPDDIEATFIEMKRQVELGKKVFHFENRYRHKNGSWRLLSWVSAPAMNGMMYATARDITEEKAVAQELRNAATRITTILNSVVDGIITINDKGIIETVNPADCRIFGYAENEMLGCNIKMLMPEPYQDEHDGYLTNYISTGEAKIIGIGREVTGVRKDGSIFPMSLAVNEMRLGDQRYFTGVVKDITTRKLTEQELLKAKEQAESAGRIKASFLASMSHEIRTPLTGMLGMLEVLSLTPLNDDQDNVLQAAWASARSLLRIVNDILDWSKIEEGKLSLSPRSTSIPQLLNDVTHTYSRVASASSLILKHYVDERISKAHIVDPLRLTQILNNFVSNALKFTQKGEVELRAELIDQLESGEMIRFSVRDTGIGIPKNVQKNLFERYQQGSSDTARQYGGTGLGLAICRRLAELLDGQIGLVSEPGRGSTFMLTLTLPVSAALDEGTARSTDTLMLPHKKITPLWDDNVTSPLVLAVDDHPTNRDLLARQLTLLGLRSETAENGLVALQKWREGRFALVITDCHMPEMDGYALTRAIREIEVKKKLPHAPIIAWTANALPGEEKLCEAAGMDDLLVKPTDMISLKEMLTKWLYQAENEPKEAVANGARKSVIGSNSVISKSAQIEKQTLGEAATESPIDYAVLDAIITDKAEQAQLLRDFVQHIHTDYSKLDKLFTQQDRAAVQSAAHRMKGSCRMVGARRLGDACALIELAAKQGEMEKVHAIVIELDEAIAELERYVG